VLVILSTLNNSSFSWCKLLTKSHSSTKNADDIYFEIKPLLDKKKKIANVYIDAIHNVKWSPEHRFTTHNRQKQIISTKNALM